MNSKLIMFIVLFGLVGSSGLVFGMENNEKQLELLATNYRIMKNYFEINNKYIRHYEVLEVKTAEVGKASEGAIPVLCQLSCINKKCCMEIIPKKSQIASVVPIELDDKILPAIQTELGDNKDKYDSFCLTLQKSYCDDNKFFEPATFVIERKNFEEIIEKRKQSQAKANEDALKM